VSDVAGAHGLDDPGRLRRLQSPRLDVIGANVSPEVVLEEAPGLTPDLRTYRGWDEVRAYLEGLHKFWEQAHIEVRRIAWADASLAAVTIRTTLTGRGSSVEVATDGGNLIEFRDRRVVRMTMYRTPEEALEVAGLSG
jgi:ketosteroid isomerase-like protein